MLPRWPETGRGLRSITELLDVNAEVGVATVKVDLADVTEATVEVVTAARFAANALMGSASGGAPTWIGHQSQKERTGRGDLRPDLCDCPRLARHRAASLAGGTAIEPGGQSRSRCCRASRQLRRVGEGPNGVDPSSPAVRGMAHQFTLTARDSVPGVKR